MKFYTILGWHTGANILTWFIAFAISILLKPFLGSNLHEDDLIPLYIFLYIVFLVLSFFYISVKGYKDAEEEKFSIIKCLFSCIIGMAVSTFIMSRDPSGETSLIVLLSSVPYSFVWYFDALKQNPGLWIAILLLINIPVFTIYYGIGNIQYNRRNAKKQITDSDSFK